MALTFNRGKQQAMNSKAMNPWALVWPCLCVLSCSRGSGDGAEASQPAPEGGNSSSERHAILWFVPENLATGLPLRALDGNPFALTAVPTELHVDHLGGGWTYVP